MPLIDSPPLSTIPPQLDNTTPIVNALQRIPIPSPKKLCLRDLSDGTRFQIWKDEVMSYLRLVSFVNYVNNRSPGSVVSSSRKPTTKWENIAQAYVIRRLLSFGVKERLVVSEVVVDLDDPVTVMEALEREQGVMFAEMAEEETKKKDGWEHVE